MRVERLDEILDEFVARAHRMVWAVMATVDPQGRPRTRVVHPVWEGAVGWVTVRPKSPKAAHLAANRFVSIAYGSEPVSPAYADCIADWVTDPAERRRVWSYIAGLEPPAGFDPGTMFPGPDDQGFGLLRLDPWRVRLGNPIDRSAERVWEGRSRREASVQ
jgi:hypothetical protein